MIKRFTLQIFYTCGRFFYKKLNLNKLPFVRKIASQFVNIIMQHILTEEYTLNLTSKHFILKKSITDSEVWMVFSKVYLVGGSRLILKDKKAFMPCLQNRNLWRKLKIFKLQEEAQLKFKVNYASKKVLLRQQKPVRHIEQTCFSALSPFSSSWVHWLFEMMPQLVALRQREDAFSLKILIENDAPRQIYETIAMLFPEENIEKIAQDEMISCDTLVVSTKKDSGWSVLWGRNVNSKLTETYYHDIDALLSVRKAVYEYFNLDPSEPEDKVFIRRKAAFRFIHNEKELAEYLLQKNYRIIEPGSMSFQEQVKCFAKTKVIVAQAGASLANLLFMKPGSTVVCMAAKSDFLNYDYFSDIAKAVGVHFEYVLGKIDDEKKYCHKQHLSIEHPLNASFIIDKNELINLLSNK